jgi:hypothetical protein
MGRDFLRIPAISNSPKYTDAIREIRNFILAVAAVENSDTVATYFGQIQGISNWIMHQVMSLKSDGDEKDTTPMDFCVLEMARCSLYLVSRMVVYPIPQPDPAPLFRLYASLLNALRQFLGISRDHESSLPLNGSVADTSVLRLAAWASVLSAVNCPRSWASAQRADFCLILRQVCLRLDIDVSNWKPASIVETPSKTGDQNQQESWMRAKKALRVEEFLWRSKEIDSRASEVWQEVVQIECCDNGYPSGI